VEFAATNDSFVRATSLPLLLPSPSPSSARLSLPFFTWFALPTSLLPLPLPSPSPSSTGLSSTFVAFLIGFFESASFVFLFRVSPESPLPSLMPYSTETLPARLQTTTATETHLANFMFEIECRPGPGSE